MTTISIPAAGRLGASFPIATPTVTPAASQQADPAVAPLAARDAQAGVAALAAVVESLTQLTAALTQLIGGGGSMSSGGCGCSHDAPNPMPSAPELGSSGADGSVVPIQATETAVPVTEPAIEPVAEQVAEPAPATTPATAMATPLPGEASYDGLTDAALTVLHTAHQHELKLISGLRAGETQGHGNGSAIDVANVPGGSHEGSAEMRAYAEAMRAAGAAGDPNVGYVIYQQQIAHAGTGWAWRDMEDRGSNTQNHFDHVHVSTDPNR